MTVYQTVDGKTIDIQEMKFDGHMYLLPNGRTLCEFLVPIKGELTLIPVMINHAEDGSFKTCDIHDGSTVATIGTPPVCDSIVSA